jgi:hypothetical protein
MFDLMGVQLVNLRERFRRERVMLVAEMIVWVFLAVVVMVAAVRLGAGCTRTALVGTFVLFPGWVTVSRKATRSWTRAGDLDNFQRWYDGQKTNPSPDLSHSPMWESFKSFYDKQS